jgi:hypothetical protein
VELSKKSVQNISDPIEMIKISLEFLFFPLEKYSDPLMADEIALKRIYNGEDSHMTATAAVIHHLFVEDLAAFTAFDATFTPEWAADWLADIQAASDQLSDRVIMYEGAAETEKVEDEMQQARNKWTTMRYFIEKAFPEDRAMLKLFGADSYLKVRKSQTKMLEFLQGLHGAAVEYKPQLMAAGCSEASIDEIATIEAALSQKNDVQNRAKRGRPRITAQRIALLNAPYVKMAQVNKAAQIVFMNSAAKRGQYVFLANRRKKKQE